MDGEGKEGRKRRVKEGGEKEEDEETEQRRRRRRWSEKGMREGRDEQKESPRQAEER